MSHARLSPSSAAIRVQCPGSVTMQERYPEMPSGDSDAAPEGTAAHWALAEMLTGRTVAEGQIAENGVVLTAEMLEAADVMHVAALEEANGVPMKIEQRVQIPGTHPTECWGTPDLRFWKTPRELHIWDFKYGHRHVPAENNWQCIEYASGALAEAGHPPGGADLGITVVIKIIQPRDYSNGGPIHEWRVPASHLRAQFNILRMKSEEALGPNPKTQPGPECRYCRARHACPALQQASWAAMDVATAAQPVNMPPADLGLEYKHVLHAQALLEARSTGLAEQLLQLAKQGFQTPGWRAEQGSGRTTWAHPDAQVLALGSAFGFDLAKPAAPVTPNQAKKAGMPEQLVKSLTHSPSGAMKLVPDDVSFTKRIFGGTLPTSQPR